MSESRQPVRKIGEVGSDGRTSTPESTTEEAHTLLPEVHALEWIHTIDLGHGIVTPGAWPPGSKAFIMSALDDIDFSGRKVLDVGCLDGLFSFEAERRGASQVFATDLATQVQSGRDSCFALASRILGSHAHYSPDVSVFDVGRLGVHDFDIVLFLGVYYHLRNPLLAFERLRQVMADGAILVVEGEVLDGDGSTAEFFYREPLGGDSSNWWVPTGECLRQWVESSYFEIVQEYPQPQLFAQHHRAGLSTGRHLLTARAVQRKDPLWGYPDDELRDFDLNDYA